MFNFEKLDAWRKAIEFADAVYAATTVFPSEERFGLTNQMRRAAVSVSSNLAEGSSRSSRKDFARFVEIATGSLFEIISQSYLARRRNYLSKSDFDLLYVRAEELGKMLSGLHRHLAPDA